MLQRYADAWQRGDMLAIVDAYHPEFTLNYPGTHTLAGRHVGKPGASQVLAEFGHCTERRLEQVVAVMAGLERGALLVREAIGPATQRIVVQRLFVYAVQDGKLKECWACGARRMAQTAAHLVDHVIPHVPVRQWMLSLPIPLRLLLAA